MSGAEAVADNAEQAPSPPPARGRRKLLLLAAAPAAVVALGAGGWFSGLLPGLLGLGHNTAAAKPHPPIPIDMPEMIANLTGDPRRPRYVKLKPQIEVAERSDVALVTAAMPRLEDMFQVYLREMRPEDLQGAAGTYRLRQELIARANIAAAPAHVVDVLFLEILVQ